MSERPQPSPEHGLVHLVATTLLDEGGGPGNSLHSWRCEYPERYGPCDCLAQTAEEVVRAILADPDAMLAALTRAGVLRRSGRNLRPCGCRAGSNALMCCDPEAPTTVWHRLVTPWRAQDGPQEPAHAPEAPGQVGEGQ